MSWFRHRPTPHEPSKIVPAQNTLKLPATNKEAKVEIKTKRKK
jgi:hypothetical protein